MGSILLKSHTSYGPTFLIMAFWFPTAEEKWQSEQEETLQAKLQEAHQLWKAKELPQFLENNKAAEVTFYVCNNYASKDMANDTPCFNNYMKKYP